jgi:predicted metal-dependent HD superfamily phosphohydrolase
MRQKLEWERIVTLDRWRALCASLGARDADAEYTRLLRAWRSWGRRYHTLAHLAACLHEFDGARHLAQSPTEVELALWYHDAVYRTWRVDNEARCAEWAQRFVCAVAGEDAAERVRDLVFATAHQAHSPVEDAALVVDIDLSILGSPAPEYDEFERNVRREYWWVPRRRFAQARGRILGSFLERPFIYNWPEFRERYETAARSNLQRAMQALSSA